MNSIRKAEDAYNMSKFYEQQIYTKRLISISDEIENAIKQGYYAIEYYSPGYLTTEMVKELERAGYTVTFDDKGYSRIMWGKDNDK